MKNQSCWKELNAQSSQKVIEELSDAFQSWFDLRRIKEKASRFSAGMNPTLLSTVHRSMARLDIPRCSNPSLQVILFI